MDIRWEEGFTISTRADHGAVTLSANRAGLVSLARIMLDLAEGVPGDHVHLDELNSLEDGSIELIVEHA